MVARRPRRLPKSLSAQLPGKARVLASAALDEGGWAVATTTSLAVLDRGGTLWRRDWHEVDHGAWEEEARTLTIEWVDGSASSRLRFAAPAPRRFPVVFRERVQASVVHAERLELPGGGVARAVIRRKADGELFSQLILDARRPPTGADQAALLALEARAREAVGLPS